MNAPKLDNRPAACKMVGALARLVLNRRKNQPSRQRLRARKGTRR